MGQTMGEIPDRDRQPPHTPTDTLNNVDQPLCCTTGGTLGCHFHFRGPLWTPKERAEGITNNGKWGNNNGRKLPDGEILPTAHCPFSPFSLLGSEPEPSSVASTTADNREHTHTHTHRLTINAYVYDSNTCQYPIEVAVAVAASRNSRQCWILRVSTCPQRKAGHCPDVQRRYCVKRRAQCLEGTLQQTSFLSSPNPP